MTARAVRRALGAALAVTIVCAVLSGCGGGSPADDARFPTVVTLGQGELFPVITNHALAVGENRVSMGLLDRDSRPVLDAAVHLRFYDLNGQKPALRSESDASLAAVRRGFVDEQSNNVRVEGEEDGVYVSHAVFDVPGDWGVQVDVTRENRRLDPIPFRFTVLGRTPEPAVGEPAPASHQRSLADGSAIADIDSSSPSRPAMHEVTVAEALKTGKPIVIAFATPAFCESRLCAPVMDAVMDPLFATYAGRATFIHIEPYDLQRARDDNDRQPVPATSDWRLQTEPWVFVVDRQGKIAGKFEGIMARDEVEAVLQQALAATS